MNSIGLQIEPVVGLVRSVQGATKQADGLWVGSGAEVSYTVLVKLPEGEAEVVGVKPSNGRLPGAFDIVAQNPGTVVVGARVNGRVDLVFTEMAYWEACNGA